MSESTMSGMPLPDPLRRRLDTHLDAIDRALAGASVPLSDRRSVTDEVETQVRQTLAERGEGEPTAADLEAVLAELDPPEAYAESVDADAASAAASAASQPARLSRVALWGLVLGFVAPVFNAGAWMVHRARAAHPAARDEFEAASRELENGAVNAASAAADGVGWQTVASVLVVLAAACMMWMVASGMIAAVQISKSQGRLYGMPLAIFNIAFYPFIGLLLLLLLLLAA